MNLNMIHMLLMEILGKDNYYEMIREANHYFEKKPECTLNRNLSDVEVINNTTSIFILLLGLSKKTININEYIIRFDYNRETKVSAEEFCNKFKKYIECVEDYKYDLLRKII